MAPLPTPNRQCNTATLRSCHAAVPLRYLPIHTHMSGPTAGVFMEPCHSRAATCRVGGLRRRNAGGLLRFGAGTCRMAGWHFLRCFPAAALGASAGPFSPPTTGARVPEKAPPTGTAAVHAAFVGWFDPPGGVHGRCDATVGAVDPGPARPVSTPALIGDLPPSLKRQLSYSPGG